MDRDEKLAQILVEFADTLGAEFAIQPILDHLVEQIVDVLPITGAGVMLMTDDDLHFVAASNDVVRRIEVLQTSGGGSRPEAYPLELRWESRT